MRNTIMRGIAGQDRNCKARPAISGFIDVVWIVSDHGDLGNIKTCCRREFPDHVSRWLWRGNRVSPNHLIEHFKHAKMAHMVAG